MFIGHFAVGMAAKRVAPRTSLGTLFAAAQLLDLVWPALVLLGVERVRVDPGNTAFTPLDFESYPWTHSLLMTLVWAVGFGLAYRSRTGYARGAWTAGALVLSHWMLDALTHRPDLPLAPGGPKVGLGLWNSVPATLIVEGTLFAVGVLLYATGTRARNRTGRVAFWTLVAVLVGLYVAARGPPPPSARAIGAAGLVTWLFIPWAVWIDRNREPVVSGG
ncbi:MAG TPA: hypothetical protein VEJ89_10750 [Myxococcaceae bacterium]|nr:hypothetical protein [Myxococcaceae bacterium]